jgi:hypothetical protein
MSLWLLADSRHLSYLATSSQIISHHLTNVIQNLPTYICGHNTAVQCLREYLLQHPGVLALYIENLVTLVQK